jgi:predicted ATPase/DNA-binding CsgD family transcriptional regulator
MQHGEAQTDRLTTRETEVARLVAQGESNLSIAESLRLSERTVESHVRSILGKLGARSRVDIANIVRAQAGAGGVTSQQGPDDNLPVHLTAFLDRTREVAEITSLISDRRLVTITGSGGVGKTRTSMQVAARLRGAFRDGVWFIELAPLNRGDYIVSTVATTLGVSLGAGDDQLERLTRALRTKASLLIFDNCEHVIEDAAQVIATILRRCPEVKILASSRQRLDIAGEEAYRLPSLEFPSRAACARIGASEAMQFPAIELFVSRARAAYNGFELTDRNAPDVAEVCCRLDGIPLAIELAASRAAILSPRQLRERLDERFRVLTGGSRGALPRHRTLLALIEWSYGLLEEPERVLFRRLGIFASGFTVEAAVAVAGSPDQTDRDTFELLSSLIDKSMLLTELHGDVVRYRMLESTRVYALEKLAAADESDAMATRHLEYLRDHFAGLKDAATRSGRTAKLLLAVETNLADVRAALDGALARGDAIGGSALLALLGIRWSALGLHAEAITRYTRFLDILPNHEALLRAQLSSILARTFSSAASKGRALATASQAVAYARASKDLPTLAEALYVFAVASAVQGRVDDASQALAEADAMSGLPASLRLSSLNARAFIYLMRGEFKEAVRSFQQQRDEQRFLGDATGEVRTVMSLAEAEHADGNSARAAALVREMLRALEDGQDPQTLGSMQVNLAGYLIAQDDFVGATDVAFKGIRLLAEIDPEHEFIVCALEHLALISAVRGDLVQAATLGGYVDAALERTGCEREPTEWIVYERLTSLLESGLDPHERATLLAQGAALTPEAAIALALRNP